MNRPPIKPGSDVKATIAGPLPRTKCPKYFGIIDMLTPPWLPARKGARRGYVDQGVGCPLENSVVIPPWWVDPATKKDVAWKGVERAAAAYPRDAFIGVDIEYPWEHDYRKTNVAHAIESKNLICKVVKTMKGIRPDLIIGVYATVPNLYWESLNQAALDKWKKAAEFCADIVKVSDVVMTVSYPHYDRDDNNDDIDIASDALNIDNEVGLTMDMYPDKPHVPWISAKIYDANMTKSRDVGINRWIALNQRLKALGCAGVAMWGFNGGQLPGIHESIMFDESIKIWSPKAAA